MPVSAPNLETPIAPNEFELLTLSVGASIHPHRLEPSERTTHVGSVIKKRRKKMRKHKKKKLLKRSRHKKR